MTKLLEKAIAAVRALPEQEQDQAAEMLMHLAGAAASADVYQVTAQERAALEEGLAQVRRGEVASEAEVAALWKKCGL